VSDALVPATVLTVVGINELDRIHTKQAPVMKPVIAGFVLGLFLYGMQALDPHLASLFAGLLVVGTLLLKGQSVFALAKGAIS